MNCLASIAQQEIEYEVIVDDPSQIPNNYIQLYYFDYQGGLLANTGERHNGLSSLGISLNGWHNITPSIYGESYFKFSYYGDAKSNLKKFPLKFSLGGGYKFGSKEVEKQVKVNVSLFKTTVEVEDTDGDFLGYVDAIGVNQILVPGTYKLETSFHGGLEYQNGTYDRNDGIGVFNSLGIYGGIVRESKVHIVTQLKDRKALSAQYMRFNFDLMFFPVAATSGVNSVGKISRLGFRLGAQGHLPGMRNFLNYMAPRVEMGYHVLNGTYFQIGLGFNLYRS